MKREDQARQIHVRVSPDLKKAVKMFCVREGETEQSWLHALIDGELKRRAPDLWSGEAREAIPSARSRRP
jgi:hypothetical protein